MTPGHLDIAVEKHDTRPLPPPVQEASVGRAADLNRKDKAVTLKGDAGAHFHGHVVRMAGTGHVTTVGTNDVHLVT